MDQLVSLIFDIKLHIASFDPEIWYRMYRNDPEFTTYARSTSGIVQYRRIFNNMIIDNIGAKRWYLLNRAHRENKLNGDDQPAVINACGTLEYFKFGNRHRDNDQPAYINNITNYRSYYTYGNRHRDNDQNGNSQPAIIDQTGCEYYKNGLMHRDNDHTGKPQPAIVFTDGEKQYFINGVPQYL